ncbi:hypothetical protein DA2_1841 [Desulfovibrio sp. A2]|nr:hypothetical protein DA2_1841 [Desulfovibrio sp. A2]
MRADGGQLSTDQCKHLLDQMREAGVFSINFNGGEPLTRPDFFDIARHAKALGFDIHLNTNGTLISDQVADQLAQCFPSLCTSVLAAAEQRHDELVGSFGAFGRMRQGVRRVLERGMKVEINVCTFKGNYAELYDIARVMAEPGVHVFCVTRYIMVSSAGSEHVLGVPETISVLDSLDRIKRDLPTYAEVKLPGPVPYCELPDEYRDRLRQWNTPCQVGYGLCRISPQGLMTPCPLSDNVIGNVLDTPFAALWGNTAWKRYEQVQHLPANCRECEELESCRGGCVFYDDCLHACGHTPGTFKWGA